jgi:uncharacterized protein with beta-barrel porin domain
MGSGIMVQADGTTTIAAAGAFTNYGRIINSSSIRNTTLKGSSLTNFGLIQVTNGGSIVLGAAGSLTSIVNGGTLSVDDLSRIVTNGPVKFLDGSTLSVTVGSDVTHGYLEINGPLDLSADQDSLDVHLNGEWPNVQQLIVKYTGARTGEFNLVTSGVMLDYSFSGRIYVTAVPEATSVAGVLAFAALVQRRAFRRTRAKPY